jgi:hypothetical protein
MTMARVAIYQFETFVPETTGKRRAEKWGTREAIHRLNQNNSIAEILEYSEMEVDPEILDADGMTAIGFIPQNRPPTS